MLVCARMSKPYARFADYDHDDDDNDQVWVIAR